MNILVGIFVILMIWRIWKGFKSGLAKETGKILSLAAALIVLSVLFLLMASILEKNIKMILVSAILLLIASVLCRLMKIITKSVETLAELPLIRTVDGLLGAVAGILEIMIAFWIMYAIIEAFPAGKFGGQVMAWTNESPLLLYVYQKNYIVNWIINLKI